ncbi:hypothetical protein E2C01_075142 [Portunus trituberculatus]|uniref:Uncharacterized protein n=1 Tax=Portunus trituberculatus TaxID=210409 RepID=A0A5B7I5C5_PORTR|nr:hypothetical protein [Portunus trituberculatus]
MLINGRGRVVLLRFGSDARGRVGGGGGRGAGRGARGSRRDVWQRGGCVIKSDRCLQQTQDNSRRARLPFMMVSRFCSRRDRLSSGGLARGDAPPIRCS